MPVITPQPDGTQVWRFKLKQGVSLP